ncbi:hypothetical protein ACMHYB_34285 [Sorangium sp. So ce1128]
MDVAAQIVKALSSAGYRQIEAIACTRSGAVFRAVAPPDGRVVRSVILKIPSDESEGPDRVGDHRVPRRIGEDRGSVIAGAHRSPPAPAPIWAPLASTA